ncbi:MAG: phosphoglucosamine mutase [Rhodospirillaceae bacterium]
MTKRCLFGTDGIRGTANRAPMTAETALALGMAAGTHFRRGDHRHTVVIGKDTRLSGYLLEPALTAGFIAAGMDVVLLGPLPTPAVAMLTRSLRADLGVMISASHNVYQDNGIKLFGPDGYKTTDEDEVILEQLMAASPDGLRVAPEALGRARRLDDGAGRYIEFVKNSFPKGMRLDGLKVAIDCAHGAAYRVAPMVLYELGADVVSIGVSPDGTNINRDAGSQHPLGLCQTVVKQKADLGIALDGDADRLVLVDQTGRVIDGDQILAVMGSHWQRSGLLQGGGVVATVMSNLGLERYLTGDGLSLIRTPVGDRYVVEQMRAGGFNLGGEQSGHIVMADHGTTGDGLMAALQVLAALLERGGTASELLNAFTPVPQLLRNVRVEGADPAALLQTSMVADAVQAGEQRLDGCGRLLIRKSGTEPLIRVMAEGDDDTLVQEVVGELCDVIASARDSAV